MLDILSYTREELSQWLRKHAYNPIHSKALYRRVYSSLDSWDAPAQDGLPQGVVAELQKEFVFSEAGVISEHRSQSDSSVKFLYRLEDGSAIESVLIPESSRITLCVSSQVGCAQACSFCHTGRMGLKRNLAPGEIVGQVLRANRWLRSNPQWVEEQGYASSQLVSNVVFMGMGEPLDNPDAVIKAIQIMIDPFGLQLAPKRVSVSTAGVVEGLQKLIAARLGVSLAFSLHSPDSAQRSKLMRINRRYPMEQVLAILQDYACQVKREFLVQYTLIAGLNDTEEMLEKLVSLLAGKRAKVNLIPYNLVEGVAYSKPDLEKVLACYRYLTGAGLRCMIRFSKGQDIAAACGQLAILEKKKAAIENQA